MGAVRLAVGRTRARSRSHARLRRPNAFRLVICVGARPKASVKGPQNVTGHFAVAPKASPNSKQRPTWQDSVYVAPDEILMGAGRQDKPRERRPITIAPHDLCPKF